MQTILNLPAKLFSGKGIDKKFPYLIDLYKKVFLIMAKEGQIKVNIPLGLQLWVSLKDCGLGMFLRTKGEYEALQTQLFIKALKPGHIFLDIGANVGYYTVLASKLVGPKGKVYAFEPEPNNLYLLKQNIDLNKCKNVVIVRQAVGKGGGIALFAVDRANPGESHLSRGGTDKKIVVKKISLDLFTRQKKLKAVDMIKMDIEGTEIQALEGAKDLLSKSQKVTLFVECNPQALSRSGKDAQDFIQTLENSGFKLEELILERSRQTVRFTLERLNNALSEFAYVGLIAQKS